MYVNLVCTCEAVFEMDTEWEDSAWLILYRFVNAHVACNYVMPAENVEYAVKQELSWMDLPPDDETGEVLTDDND